MQQAVKTVGGEHRLSLGEVPDGLIEDKLVSAEAAEQLKKERRYYRGTMHPLAIVADQKWKKGNALLTLDALSEWLAKRVGLEYRHIDPLKIDFAAVTEVMSSAYATRFRILPVGVSAKETVVATAEPHVREWEAELSRISKREIRRVISNPLDIERYQVEFYNLAKSIKGANRTASGGGGPSNFEQADVELRLSTLPTAFGEKIVMRIFDPEVLVRDFRELGFSDDDQKRWNEMTARPNGIVLVTGPTGSGKTTTLYSTLKTLATPEVNVCTIEDPIEMVEPAFNQMQVQPAIELGFAEGVRALMRQDPDIIMVGEIRDLETAEMALQPALTAKSAELAAVREQAMKEGMKPLRISGAMKVAAGVTTIDEVLKVAPPIRDASAG